VPPSPEPVSGELLFKRQLAQRYQREKQQGLGNPIISEDFKGEKWVAVGNQLYHSPRWKTFFDFLWEFGIRVISPQWFQDEKEKPEADRHPLFTLQQLAYAQIKARQTDGGKVNSAPTTGTMERYFRLAYHLYLVSHNGGLPDVLLARLKKKDQFRGAEHELFVAATFILAGFTIEFEDETDNRRKHCEYTVTHRKTGMKYSVEAKARAGAPSALVRSLLGDALSKQADHPRLVWVAINMPAADAEAGREVLKTTLNELRSREEKPLADGTLPPPACVVVSNNPYAFAQENSNFAPSAFAEGFRIPDLKFDMKFSSVREMRLNRDKHRPIHDLVNSMEIHHAIPTTFDGQDPVFAYGGITNRLLIGNLYEVPGPAGKMVTARLEGAVVNVAEKSAYGFYRTDPDGNFMVTCPLSDAEMAAYLRMPETFFGILEPNAMSRARDPLELYDWLFETYRKTPKEKLLEFVRGSHDEARLQGLSQHDLAVEYCERCAGSIFQQQAAKQAAKPGEGQSNG